ncbi:hypothetical protein J6590_078723 [Homalodisca vitripennis]|nr:hypothetical protein J6590_078723 [Homalodisca vitripennis]
MRAARTNNQGLTGSNLYDRGPSNRIYINDHLSPHNKNLLWRARQLVKERNIVGAWTRDGKVFVKTSAEDNSAPTTVGTVDDLDELLTR